MSTSFDIKTIIKQLDNNAIKAVNKSLEYLEIKIDEKTPIDSWEYQRWNKKLEARKIWESIIGVLYNDSKNSEEVEYWFRKTPVNWHKHKKRWWPVIYTWVWARVYTRTFDLEQENVINIIKKQLW